MSSELTDEQRAVIAAANGEPLPNGWVVIKGELLLELFEHEQRRQERLEARNKAKAVSDLRQAESGTQIDMVLRDG